MVEVEIIPSSMFVEGTIFERRNARADLMRALQWKADLRLREAAADFNISELAKQVEEAERKYEEHKRSFNQRRDGNPKT